MISPHDFYHMLRERGVSFFSGVPDSLLKNFCSYVDDHAPANHHVIAANEGNAIAMAAGFYLASGKIPAVYMQNSGLGNAINPLVSLTSPEVYRIPILLIIGWRGDHETKDEPQHIKQGKITTSQLDLISIPYHILSSDSDPEKLMTKVFSDISSKSSPVAILVRPSTFLDYEATRKSSPMSEMKREKALNIILDHIGDDTLIVSTTGKTSREIFELRTRRGEPQHDFLVLGSMGHASSIALGVAISTPSRRVLCVDGDGAALMHLGALTIIGDIKPSNFIHVILNNSSHESVGGQRSVAGSLDFKKLIEAVNYSHYLSAQDEKSLKKVMENIDSLSGPLLLEVKIAKGSRADLGRPTKTPEQIKKAFMEHSRV